MLIKMTVMRAQA